MGKLEWVVIQQYRSLSTESSLNRHSETGVNTDILAKIIPFLRNGKESSDCKSGLERESPCENEFAMVILIVSECNQCCNLLT